MPTYRDENADDAFSLGGDELVPVRIGLVREVVPHATHRVDRFRPRTEGDFARVERWCDFATGEVHWRSISRDNLEHIYGRSAAARIADPDDASRVFRWLLEEVRDDRGNLIQYEYLPEDWAGVTAASQCERNRVGRPQAARHLKRIRYGNHTPTRAGDWHFEAVFDYGEHDEETPTVEPARPWPVRLDAFSTGSAGFEVRTLRLCRRVLMFHRFADLGTEPVLVRTTELGYDEQTDGSSLRRVTVLGLPPLELEYARARVDDQPRTLDGPSLAELPGGVTGAAQWIDLDGDGVPGILVRTAGGWYFKRNLGDGRFATARRVTEIPNTVESAPQIVSLEGDGRRELLVGAGYHERDADGRWGPFRPLTEVPRADRNDSSARYLDLDGDGRTDLLVSAADGLRWYPSRGRAGFGGARRIATTLDEEEGPASAWNDRASAILFADMTGDGLTDIVRVRNGEVCYWANLGHGRFGRKVTMERAPVFDTPDRFRADRVQLVDLDGTGAADLLYSGAAGVRYWINQSGNSWGEEGRIRAIPPADDISSVTVVDLLGNGTACLVWSSPLAAQGGMAMRYVDLHSGQRPGHLTSVRNNLGAVTTMEYGASVVQRRQDWREGHDWTSRPPTPQVVVEQLVQRDEVARVTHHTTYRYRDGYHDWPEREARGFARVDRVTQETFDPSIGRSLHSAGAARALSPPAVLTRTWYDVGALYARDALTVARDLERYAGDPPVLRLGDADLPPRLSVVEEREAMRAMRGRTIREELYEVGTAIPQRVQIQRGAVLALQRGERAREASLWAHERETLELVYEGTTDEPRVSHQIVLDVDGHGNITQAAEIAYPRSDPKQPEQSSALVTVTERRVANELGLTSYRLGAEIETTKLELAGIATTALTLLSVGDLRRAAVAPTRRLLEHARSYYTRDDLSGPLPLGQIGQRALLHDERRLSLTDELIRDVFGVGAVDPLRDGHYLREDGAWWAGTGRWHHDPDRFYVVVAHTDSFGHVHHATWDAATVAAVALRDPLGNQTTAAIDYRFIATRELVDPNGNHRTVRFDTLGRVIAVAHRGKPGVDTGDTLDSPTTAFAYDWDQFATTGLPARTERRDRERHGDATSPLLVSFAYHDGRGHLVLRKNQAEPDGGTQLRWIGSERDVRDARGEPVKTYAPYFSHEPAWEDETQLAAIGAVSLQRRDAAGRVVHVDAPDGTFTRIEHAPWQATHHDADDVVRDSVWYANARASTDAKRRRAADLSAAHAGTPRIVHLDPLGREVVTVDDGGSAGQLTIRTTLDALGRPLAIIDALQRHAGDYVYDFLGRTVWTRSIDAGERRVLSDVAGKPVVEWDSRDHRRRRSYDALQRATTVSVAIGATAAQVVELTVYGEDHLQARERNLRGRIYERYDGAGRVRQERYDFDGNPTRIVRELVLDRAGVPDWTALAASPAPARESIARTDLEREGFMVSSTFDALGRITQQALRGSELRLTYERTGQLAGATVQLAGALATTPVLTRVSYSATGQPVRMERSGVTTVHEYDPHSQRLVAVRSTRARDGARLQGLRHVHDAVGNLVEIVDEVQPRQFFANSVATAGARYEYDALDRLVAATGREHARADRAPDADDLGIAPLPSLTDGQAVREYRQTFRYDLAGNLLAMAHHAAGAPAPRWVRRFAYDGGVSPRSNRLDATNRSGDLDTGPFSDRYLHDAHGNVTRMPHLRSLTWDHADRLISVDLIGGGEQRCTYDASGQRVRTVIARQGGLVHDRVYLGAFEVYRRRRGDRVLLERETIHIGLGPHHLAIIETKTIDDGALVALRTPLVRQQLADHQGSAAIETDATGRVISFEEFHPYGTSSYRAGAGETEVSRKRFRYTGKERDDGTSFAYHGARHYAPWLARWTSADPAGVVDGPNLFAYCRNNPTTFIDPTGHQTRNIQEAEQRGKQPVLTTQQVRESRERAQAQNIDGPAPIAFIPSPRTGSPKRSNHRPTSRSPRPTAQTLSTPTAVKPTEAVSNANERAAAIAGAVASSSTAAEDLVGGVATAIKRAWGSSVAKGNAGGVGFAADLAGAVPKATEGPKEDLGNPANAATARLIGGIRNGEISRGGDLFQTRKDLIHLAGDTFLAGMSKLPFYKSARELEQADLALRRGDWRAFGDHYVTSAAVFADDVVEVSQMAEAAGAMAVRNVKKVPALLGEGAAAVNAIGEAGTGVKSAASAVGADAKAAAQAIEQATLAARLQQLKELVMAEWLGHYPKVMRSWIFDVRTTLAAVKPNHSGGMSIITSTSKRVNTLLLKHLRIESEVLGPTPFRFRPDDLFAGKSAWARARGLLGIPMKNVHAEVLGVWLATALGAEGGLVVTTNKACKAYCNPMFTSLDVAVRWIHLNLQPHVH